jgi:two-component system, chemotaxis family, sensor kinase CheA
MTPPHDERMTELRALFFESAQELLQSLNDDALRLEKNPADSEIVRSIRRTVHTLKGDAAACGYRELSEIAHEMEDALALDSAAAHTGLPEIAFAAADLFAALLNAYRKNSKLPSSEPLRKKIASLTSDPASKKTGRKTKKTAPAKAVLSAWTEYEKLALENAQQRGLQAFHIVAQIDPHCAMPIAGRQLLQNALAEIGEVLAVRPEAGTAAAAMELEILLATTRDAAQVTAKCRIPTIIASARCEQLAPAKPVKRAPKPETETPNPEAAPSPAEAPSAPEPALAAPAPQIAPEPETAHDPVASSTPAQLAESILRVDAERIDSVLNLVGELIIGKSMFQQAFNEFAKAYPKDALRGKFADAMGFQTRVLNDLQRSVMKIRMVPVEQLFRRFPRMVRDVALQCGKDVDLVLTGQDTDLDKSILDAIAEPLTHLVRNAISHGIETAAERERAGKPPRGQIRLNAHHQGNQVILEVRDDGRGIDAQQIKAKAIQLGLLTAEEGARISETEALNFIFRPGFSTAQEVTEISGRGVGMDVVQSVLLRLKGSVTVETHPGQGTTFRLKLPLTLAIIKALLFHVQSRLYAIPLNAVVEIARTVETEVHRVDHYEVIQLRNQVLPLVRLGQQTSSGGSQKLFVLVISAGERKFGLIVDGLEGEEELVIKALDDHAVSTDLVSGASILGDGRVVLILNLSAIIERFARMAPDAATGTIASGLLLSHADRARMSASSAGGRA